MKKEFHHCTECGWSISFDTDFGTTIQNSPPCPRCNANLDGFRIIDRKKK